MNAIRCIQRHSLLCMSWLATEASCMFNYPGPRIFPHSPSARAFSIKDKETINYLSDIEKYIEKDFTMSDLKRKFDEENFPTPVTTATLLSECETTDNVLDILKNAVLSGKLWKDEITLYFDALKVHKGKRSDSYSSGGPHAEEGHCEITNPSALKLLDSPYFQFLIKEALVHSPRLTTRELAFLLHCFVTLEIPPASNTMLILVSVMQNRINDFFPIDVLNSFRSIRRMKSDGLAFLDSFRKGLVQHLENQTVDDLTLQKVLMGTSISDRLQLQRIISFEGPVSSELKGAILRSVIETLNTRSRKDLRNLQEAESVLRFSLRNRSTFLLQSVVHYFSENVHEIRDEHKEIISLAKRNLKAENFEVPSLLEIES